MKRSELEHLIRASAGIADDDEIIVIGSQSILGQYPDAPVRLLASMEAGVYPKNKPELAELVDGSIGEGSFFHAEFGYYAQGVGPNTAVLPEGWQDRLVSIKNENTKDKIEDRGQFRKRLAGGKWYGCWVVGKIGLRSRNIDQSL